MEIDKTLEALDFKPHVECVMRNVVWTMPGAPLPDGVGNLGEAGCQQRGTTVAFVRLCSCWHDVRQFVLAGMNIDEFVFHHGLLVRRLILCDTHASYFSDYVHYPLLCFGCGLYFENANEILLGEQDTREML